MAAKHSVAILTAASLVVVACGTERVRAQSLETMQLAIDLGAVIAAETFCGLTFDQLSVAAFIEKKVKPNDMSFPTTLQTVIEGSKFQHQSMSPSAKTAHCTQIKRIAETYGFVK